MDLQTHLKTILKKKYQKLGDILLPFNVNYPQDLKTAYDQHYNRHIDFSHRDRNEGCDPCPFEDLLKCDCKHSKSKKTVVTLGACGIGKTTAVQRCALDWAEGRAYKDIDLLFIISCWELSLLEKEELSLIELLQTFYPDLKELTASHLSSKKIWFVFDELEDLNGGEQLFLCPKVYNVNQATPVRTLLPNLIKGNLLPHVHIWITSRYAAGKFIRDCYKLRETEMRGFNDEQKELHIKNLVGDDHLANRIIDHIKMSRSLYYLCQIPYMCTVMATVLKRHVKADDYKICPMTLTEIYSSLTEDCRSELLPKLKNASLFANEDMNHYLCWMNEEELMETVEMTVDEVSLFAQDHPLVFREEKSVRGVSVFRFAHISVLEYFVALDKLVNVTTSNSQDQVSLCFHEMVLDEAHDADGQYDICLRFMFGLFKERSTLQPSDPFFADIKKLFFSPFFNNSVMLFHCLREFDSKALPDDVMTYFEMGPPPTAGHNSFRRMIINVEGKRDKFEMELSSRCDERVLRSLSALLKSKQAILRFSNLSDTCCPALASVLGSKESYLRDLDLSFNSIGDKGVQSLVQGLNAQDCRLRSLSLQSCELTSLACVHLATVLARSPQLKELDISCNDLGDVGMQFLACGLQSPNSQLETLKISQCYFGIEGCFHLASALEKNPNHLKWLDLSVNVIGPEAANELFTKFDISRLTKLEMYYCGLTEQCCEKIADALKYKNGNLVEINLSSNELKDKGAYWITDGLYTCSRLKKLNLSRCAISALGGFYLSKVLGFVSAVFREGKEVVWKSNEVKEINLSLNDFADEGASNIFSGFRNPFSHIQKLNLSECGFTAKCCKDLAAPLSSGQCRITELDLSGNCVHDTGVKKISWALRSHGCALQKLFLRNCCLSSKCVLYFQEDFKTNQHLRELFLLGNDLDDSAIKLLVFMTKNPAMYRLKTIDLSVE